MKLCIYMKSGNKIVIRGIKTFRARYDGNEIVELTIHRNPRRLFGHCLHVETMDLSQIEAITQHWFWM